MENMTPTPRGNDEWENWEELPNNHFVKTVMQGRGGKNTGFPTGSDTLDSFINGTHEARYYLVAADSGVGKTTIADFFFVFNLWSACKRQGRAIQIMYCSYEIGRREKIARWCSLFIYARYGHRLSADYIMGYVTNHLVSDEHLEWIKTAYKKISEMFKDIKFIDITVEPHTLYEGVVAQYERYGKVNREEISQEEKENGYRGKVLSYEPGDNSPFTVLFVDHVSLTDEAPHSSLKQSIDILSKYAVKLKNIFQTTIVFVQQFNTDLLTARRTAKISAGKKFDLNSIAPTRSDFGDTRGTYRDAEVVLGLIRPGDEVPTVEGWDVTANGLGSCGVLLYLMKNRYGKDHERVKLFVDGVSGFIQDLPDFKSCEPQQWYNLAREIDESCQYYQTKSPRPQE